jgi:cytochrome c-type protein NapB
MNSQIKTVLILLFAISTLGLASLSSADEVATLRKGVKLDVVNDEPELLRNALNKDVRRGRDYPMQPPTIPHHINNYQIDLKANKCLSCHSRTRVEESQAPMISVTHFMDRDGNFLADVSPRRFFCTQCHVTQVENDPLLKNLFIDVKHLSEKE